MKSRVISYTHPYGLIRLKGSCAKRKVYKFGWQFKIKYCIELARTYEFIWYFDIRLMEIFDKYYGVMHA